MSDLLIPLPQSEAFERAFDRMGVTTQRFTHPGGTCLVQTRKLPLIGPVNLISRGPVIEDPAAFSPFLKEIRARLRGPLIVNAPAGIMMERGLKIASGAELALINLKPEIEARADLRREWRNRLRKAEKSPLTIVDQPLDKLRHKWFLEAETAQQKTRRYRTFPAAFMLAFAAANKGQARLYSALVEGKPVAAMLILRHGAMATYQAGVSLPDGRVHCAHNLILWTAMTDLYKRGVRQLDLGRADNTPGLTRFKRGAGAQIVALPGSYFVRRFAREEV